MTNEQSNKIFSGTVVRTVKGRYESNDVSVVAVKADDGEVRVVQSSFGLALIPLADIGDRVTMTFSVNSKGERTLETFEITDYYIASSRLPSNLCKNFWS